MDIKAGPRGQAVFPFPATVECRYVVADLGGQSLTFPCALADERGASA